jgi:hypothetical protein
MSESASLGELIAADYPEPPNYPSPMASGPLRRVSRHVPRHPRPRSSGDRALVS